MSFVLTQATSSSSLHEGNIITPLKTLPVVLRLYVCVDLTGVHQWEKYFVSPPRICPSCDILYDISFIWTLDLHQRENTVTRWFL